MKTDRQTVSEDRWKETFSAGLKALDKGSLVEAIKQLEVAVDIAGQLGLIEPLIDSLLALADAQRMHRQYDEAEATLKTAVEFSSKLRAKHSVSRAFCLGGLGRFYLEQNKTNDAIYLLENAVRLLRRHRHSAEPEYLTVFLALTSCYLQVQDFDKADKLSRYTYDLSKELVGPNDAATVMAMTMCAASAAALGKQRRADILNCQIRTITQVETKNGVSDKLGIAAAMLRRLRANGIIEKKPIVISFDGE